MRESIPYSDDRWFVVYKNGFVHNKYRKKRMADHIAQHMGGYVKRMGIDMNGNYVPMKRPEVIKVKNSEEI